MQELFVSESSIKWCGIGEALVHYSTTRPLLGTPTIRNNLTDYNSVRLTYLITTPNNSTRLPKF